jgi:hypothetical protein
MDWTSSAPEPHAFMWDARGQTKNSYTDFRFLLAYALLGDVYYSFTTWDAGEHRYIYYYDEYDIELGYPRSQPIELSSECHVRYFDGGLVIINASGAPQTVTDGQLRSETSAYYEGPYYKFQGGQQPQWNDGTEFTSIDLIGSSHEYNTQFGEAIILVEQPQIVVSDIIVDDCFSGTSPSSEDPVFLDSWTRGDQRGAEFWCMCNRPYQDLFAYMYTFPGDGESQAIYTPTIGVAGNYEVFEYHGYMGDTPEHIQEGTNVPYTINYAYGMATSGTIDQTVNYGQWNSLGTHYFEAGQTGNVIINNDADGMVIADAFKFVFRGTELDTEAPNAPSNLYASTITENSITLAWTAPPPAPDGDGASAYQVFRDGALVGTPAEPTFVDAELTESTSYSYTVYAVDNGGNRSVDGISGTYSTVADATGPSLISATGTGVGTVEVKFNEDVEQASAESIHNYTIEPTITVFSASLQSDYRTVELATSAHVVGASYTVTVNNVRDRAVNPNPITAGSSANYVGYAGMLNIAITGDDSYELYVNGEQIGYGNTWYQSQRYEVSSVGGKNVVAVKCVDAVDKGGFLAEIEFNGQLYVTDDNWRATTEDIPDWHAIDLNDLTWPKATECGLHGVALPWAQYNNVQGISTDNGAQWIWSADQENDNTVWFRLVLNTGGDITPPAPPQGVTVSSQ